MRDHRRVMHRQHHHRGAEADFRRHRRGVGQHDDGVEAEDVVEGVLGHPQVAETERLGALRDRFTDAMSIGSGERWGSDMPSGILSFKAMLGPFCAL